MKTLYNLECNQIIIILKLSIRSSKKHKSYSVFKVYKVFILVFPSTGYLKIESACVSNVFIFFRALSVIPDT